jgi:hypothetical protein
VLAQAGAGVPAGLLSRAERKNGWTIAELAGDGTPDGMQRLLNFYSWSADDVRDDLREYIAAGLGDPGGVLICDETRYTAAMSEETLPGGNTDGAVRIGGVVHKRASPWSSRTRASWWRSATG